MAFTEVLETHRSTDDRLVRVLSARLLLDIILLLSVPLYLYRAEGQIKTHDSVPL